MSGTFRGRIEIVLNEGSEERDTSGLFKNLFDILEAHPNTTRIALQYGTHTGTEGTDFWDGTNPFGTDAFAVYRMNTSAARTWTYYMMIQCNVTGVGPATSSFGSAPGDPGLCRSLGNTAKYVGVQVAVGVGGDNNPWNGTTNNDGTDSKAGSAANPTGTDGTDNVWRVPASGGTGLGVLPASNSSEYAHNLTDAQLENMGDAIQDPTANFRANIIMDDDNLWVLHDTNLGNAWQIFYVGLFTPIPGLTYPHPLMMIPRRNIPMGDTDALVERAGVLLGDLTRPHFADRIRWALSRGLWSNTSHQPNPLVTPAVHDARPLKIYSGGVNLGHARGFVGTWDSTPEIYNAAVVDTPASLNECYFGSATTAATKLVIPWDGTTTPNSGSGRTGVSFTRAP